MSKKVFNNINEILVKSITAIGQKEYECNIELTEKINNEVVVFKAYEVSIANRDILFFTDKGTLNYLVDSGLRDITYELYDYELDQGE